MMNDTRSGGRRGRGHHRPRQELEQPACLGLHWLLLEGPVQLFLLVFVRLIIRMAFVLVLLPVGPGSFEDLVAIGFEVPFVALLLLVAVVFPVLSLVLQNSVAVLHVPFANVILVSGVVRFALEFILFIPLLVVLAF
ncbi:hypothetical protein H257_15176 [Aphanomyces astaci]|uniref:Uncharacterized protein n=1 Tax=Aphanomyces astaci TaxID=112090 RepID=W4FQT4_APHAT|nr:hypothetical protein H257_15176 [Aphanomyces astaci]ETV69023.1 hypothetical protein H257_15176 [Aphanomyces astaci]|eukprot:XP_009841482.1 hypothetical protein H257_15176 [Aphanomyces astaci]